MVKNEERVIYLPFNETVFDGDAAESIIEKFGSLRKITTQELVNVVVIAVNKICIDGYRFLGIISLDKDDGGNMMVFEKVSKNYMYEINISKLHNKQNFHCCCILDQMRIFMIANVLNAKDKQYALETLKNPYKNCVHSTEYIDWEKESKTKIKK